MNTKGIQVKHTTEDASTQTEWSFDTALQIKPLQKDVAVGTETLASPATPIPSEKQTPSSNVIDGAADDLDESIDHGKDGLDSSFCVSQDEMESENEEVGSAEIIFEKKRPNGNDPPEKIDDNEHIFYWPSLLSLLCRCFTCSSAAAITKRITYGSALYIEMLYQKAIKIYGDHNHWSVDITKAISNLRQVFFLVLIPS